jgi:hypothetical protein
MGTSESRNKKLGNKLSIASKIKEEFNCPLCNKKFTENMTFIQLNQHLKRCGNIHNNSSKNARSFRRIDLSFDNDRNKKIQNNNNIIKTPIRRYGSIILEEISKNKKIDFIFSEEKSLEKNISINDKKKIGNNKVKIIGTFEERINQMSEYLNLKKSQYKAEFIIKGENVFQLLEQLKNISIYQKIVLILKTKENEKKLNLNDLIFQYFDLMIKLKYIEIINGKTIALSFRNKIDYELLGYILAILLIYPDIKINYKLPKLICKILINEKLSLNDIQYENESFYDYILKLKNKNDFSKLDLYFNYEGYDLVPNGNEIKVDEYNFEEYIDKMIEYETNKYIKKINIIRDSVFRYIPKSYIMNFKGDELYQIINRLI